MCVSDFVRDCQMPSIGVTFVPLSEPSRRVPVPYSSHLTGEMAGQGSIVLHFSYE